MKRTGLFDVRTKWLVGLALCSLPLSLAVTHVLLLLAFLNGLFFGRYQRKENVQGFGYSWVLPFIAYFLLQVWSAFRPGDQGLALSKLETAEAFLVVPFIALSSGRIIGRERKFLLRAFFLGLILAMTFSLVDALRLLIQTGSWMRYWPSGMYRDHHFFYIGLADPLMHPGYYSTLLGVGLFAAWTNTDVVSRKQLLWGSLFALIFLLLLQARINLLAFGAVVGIWTIYLGRVRGQWRPLLFLVVTLGLLTAFLPVMPDRIKDRILNEFTLEYDLRSPTIDEFTGFTIRLAEWQCAAEPISANPIWGVGNGRAPEALYKVYEEKGFAVGLERRFNCHNQFLEIQLAHGIPGTLILFWMMFSIFRIAWRKSSVGLGLVTLFQLLCMVTESMWQRHLGATSFVFLTVLFILFAQGKNNQQPVEKGEEQDPGLPLKNGLR